MFIWDRTQKKQIKLPTLKKLKFLITRLKKKKANTNKQGTILIQIKSRTLLEKMKALYNPTYWEEILSSQCVSFL